MLAWCWLPLPPYYTQNYAEIIGSSLNLSFTFYSFQNFLKFLHIILTLLPYKSPIIIPMEFFKFYSVSDNDVIIHIVGNIWVYLVWLRQKHLSLLFLKSCIAAFTFIISLMFDTFCYIQPFYFLIIYYTNKSSHHSHQICGLNIMPA